MVSMTVGEKMVYESELFDFTIPKSATFTAPIGKEGQDKATARFYAWNEESGWTPGAEHISKLKPDLALDGGREWEGGEARIRALRTAPRSRYAADNCGSGPEELLPSGLSPPAPR